MMAHFHHLAFKFYHNRKLMSLRSNELIIYCFFAGIFKVALNHKKLGISKEILATRVLPFLFPLSIENSLTPTQHSAIMVLIKVSEKQQVQISFYFMTLFINLFSNVKIFCQVISVNLKCLRYFQTFFQDMTERVESEHRTKLEQLNSIKDEQK